MAKIFASLLLATSIFLSACATVSQQEYADNLPAIDMRDFFNGDLIAHGIVKDRSGKVIRYFNASIKASWKNSVGTLDETFYFDDGEVQKRIWTLQSDATGQLMGSANDVIGSSPLFVYGNSLFMDYVLRVPYEDDSVDLSINDRMYRITSSLMNPL